MMKTLALICALFAVAGCASTRTTGDIDVPIPDVERVLQVNAGRATLRILNRGMCSVTVRHGEVNFVLATSEDREIVLEGEHVLHFERTGQGEGLVEIHFTTDGRKSSVHLK